jgi:hypothetical protein
MKCLLIDVKDNVSCEIAKKEMHSKMRRRAVAVEMFIINVSFSNAGASNLWPVKHFHSARGINKGHLLGFATKTL